MKLIVLAMAMAMVIFLQRITYLVTYDAITNIIITANLMTSQ